MKMDIAACLVVLAVGLSPVVGQTIQSSEAQCYSRFDYEYNVIQKLVKMDDMQKQFQSTIDIIQAELLEKTASGSDVYTRWGRTTCGGNGTELVYEGYAAGSPYSQKGAAANYICLPSEPLWGHYTEGKQDHGALVYGAEYELTQRLRTDYFKRDIYNHDAPCAVCRTRRSSVVMIPGRNACYPGWTMEYKGYLAAGYHGHDAASEFVCLDDEAESVEGGNIGQDGKLFYFVEVRCGSLKCPPYVEGRELACVVCSK